jgi:hypothetical protein
VSKRLGLALPLRPVAALGQEQESGGTSAQTRSGGGLGAIAELLGGTFLRREARTREL